MLSEKNSRFLRDLWHLIRPYWFSEDQWAARGLLVAIIALTLGMVCLTVRDLTSGTTPFTTPCRTRSSSPSSSN